jgi:tetratricopeptide (TPR) repeat protein
LDFWLIDVRIKLITYLSTPPFVVLIGMATLSPATLIHQSVFLRRQSRFATAIENSTLALTLDPSYIQAWVERGIAKLESNDALGALADFEQAILLNPLYAKGYFGRGWARGLLGDYDGEIEDAECFIRFAPHETALYYQRLEHAYSGKGQYWIALTWANRLLDKASNDVEGLYRRARLFYLLKKYGDALHDLNHMVTLKPKDWRGWYLRGKAYMAKDEFSVAIKDFSRVIRLRPQWAEPYYHRALAYFESGKFEDAEADIACAELLEPNSFMMMGSEFH